MALLTWLLSPWKVATSEWRVCLLHMPSRSCLMPTQCLANCLLIRKKSVLQYHKPRCTAKCTKPSDRFLASAECTLTNCQVGLNVHEGVCVVLKNNDISFNEVGLIFDGYGIIQDNKMWGNLHRSTIDLGKEALARAKVRLHASSSPSDCTFAQPHLFRDGLAA